MRNLDNGELYIDNETVFGDNNIIYGNRNVIEGDNNKIYGHNCRVSGNNNTVVGKFAVIKGRNNRVSESRQPEFVEIPVAEREPASPVIYSEEEPEQAYVPGIEIPNAETEVVCGENQSACIICYVNQVRTTVLNCGHSNLCITCARRLVRGGEYRCPTCKQNMSKIIRIYQ